MTIINIKKLFERYQCDTLTLCCLSIPYQDCTQAQRSAARETLAGAHPNADICIDAQCNSSLSQKHKESF